MNERFLRFVKDESAAIEQLKAFVGGELANALDGTDRSLQRLDEFVRGLTRDPGWYRSPLFQPEIRDARSWLTVRLAYYLAMALRNRYGCDWYLSEGQPALALRGVEIRPLEIAKAHIEGSVEGGLAGVARDIESLPRA